jgi:chloramphenicol 3-O-phosphotransferase
MGSVGLTLMATCVVLNGASGSGKSSLAARLQARWPRPLQVAGIDTFLAAQSESFFGIEGRIAEGFN